MTALDYFIKMPSLHGHKFTVRNLSRFLLFIFFVSIVFRVKYLTEIRVKKHQNWIEIDKAFKFYVYTVSITDLDKLYLVKLGNGALVVGTKQF